MKLSTARKVWCMSYFALPSNIVAQLATAKRTVYSGDVKRYLFPDGSVLESTKGHWKVMKNPKLEAAVKRFGAGGYVGPFPKAPVGETPNVINWDVEFPSAARPFIDPSRYAFDAKIPTDERCHLLAAIEAQRRLLDEKDEQLDKASRPMVVRLDWWAVALVGLVLVAHYGFGVL